MQLHPLLLITRKVCRAQQRVDGCACHPWQRSRGHDGDIAAGLPQAAALLRSTSPPLRCLVAQPEAWDTRDAQAYMLKEGRALDAKGVVCFCKPTCVLLRLPSSSDSTPTASLMAATACCAVSRSSSGAPSVVIVSRDVSVGRAADGGARNRGLVVNLLLPAPAAACALPSSFCICRLPGTLFCGDKVKEVWPGQLVKCLTPRTASSTMQGHTARCRVTARTCMYSPSSL
jgi:hypothetical protein